MDENPEEPSGTKDRKTIYDAGYASIFLRNFLAGFARALGGLLVYILLGGLIYYLALTYVLPQIQRLLPKSFPSLGPGTFETTPNDSLTPEQLQGALQRLKEQ